MFSSLIFLLSFQTAFGGSITSSGGNGLSLVTESPLNVAITASPLNAAVLSTATPFATSCLSGYTMHQISHLNDGLTGNSNSWIGTAATDYVGIAFGTSILMSGFAFGRDNEGTYTDRTLSTYTIRYTRLASPGLSTTVTEDPSTGWSTLGTLAYSATGTSATYLSNRHTFSITPVLATAIRIDVGNDLPSVFTIKFEA
jgi:hypothetical protein